MCEMLQELSNNSYNEGWKGGLAEGWEGGMAKGKAEGKAEGMADGEMKKAKETAVALSGKGWTSDQIAEIVKYDSEEIEKWLKEYRASLS